MLTDEQKELILQWEAFKREQEIRKGCDEFNTWAKSLDGTERQMKRFSLGLCLGLVLYLFGVYVYFSYTGKWH